MRDISIILFENLITCTRPPPPLCSLTKEEEHYSEFPLFRGLTCSGHFSETPGVRRSVVQIQTRGAVYPGVACLMEQRWNVLLRQAEICRREYFLSSKRNCLGGSVPHLRR